ncbi:hypothetical protein GCM10012320_32870 [Sinomonas cellulolyticus]|uniref:Uncharacterized protein n=1 Tax=Sinomonas cellulolyticus TaxID=2801916 RepID=A0ABS1JXA5_9MICC|nr:MULTISPECIES: hypothetical protein [Sinomonas]MBL0703980.1 hypothetical protein [Sinomonas cellulolyticus]GHG59010.1 hypothetical protein GCM10012320_32870 [Sinomonas sp. KCTC 49339]
MTAAQTRGPWAWGPEHTPALARAILAHPATAHLPPYAATDLIHAAGHDLRRRTGHGTGPGTATDQILREIAHGPYQYLLDHTLPATAPDRAAETPEHTAGPGPPRHWGQDGPGPAPPEG